MKKVIYNVIASYHVIILVVMSLLYDMVGTKVVNSYPNHVIELWYDN